jgi:hypothetical protein
VQTERDVAVHPHQSARNGSDRNSPFGLVQVGQNTARALEKGLPLGGEQQLAGRAIDQPRAQPPFQPRHKLTDRRRRHAQSPTACTRSVLEKFAAMQMIDLHLPTTDGRELLLTRYTEPEPDLSLLLKKLKLELPTQPPQKITAAPVSPTPP